MKVSELFEDPKLRELGFSAFTPRFQGDAITINLVSNDHKKHVLITIHKDGKIEADDDKLFNKNKNKILSHAMYMLFFRIFRFDDKFLHLWTNTATSIIGTHKQSFIKAMLIAYRQCAFNNMDINVVKQVINFARAEGYDYAEFKAIEKSII